VNVRISGSLGKLRDLFASLGEALERHKDAFASLQAIATIFAFAVGGFWTYLLTTQFRETAPKLAIKHAVSSWRLDNGSILLRVDSTVTNSGKGLIKGLNGKLIVLRLFPETPEQAANYAKGKVLFDCTDDRGLALKKCVSEQGLKLPTSSKHELPIADAERKLEPGESESYWRYIPMDGSVRTVEVMTFIDNPDTEGRRGWVFDDTHEVITLPK
jgi:hypothetical protein